MYYFFGYKNNLVIRIFYSNESLGKEIYVV